MGITSLGILVVTGGKVALLVVLYSINVFLTFSMSLLGLCIYWWQHRDRDPRWRHRLALSLGGFIVTASILLVTLVERFTEGGMTVLITGAVIGFCLLNHAHYASIKEKIRIADEALNWTDYPTVLEPPALNPKAPTAVFVVGSSRSGGVYALEWVRREFPGHFKNFVFMNVRTVDAQSYGGEENMERLRAQADQALAYFVNYCNHYGLAAKSFLSFGHGPD